MTIAEKLYKLRTDFGLSQKEFAEKAGVSQSAINYWENGKRQPKTSQIKKIAKAFDVALYILIDDKYELEDVTSEAYKKSARFVGDTEMMKPPIFTVPRTSYNMESSVEQRQTFREMAKEMLKEYQTPNLSAQKPQTEKQIVTKKEAFIETNNKSADTITSRQNELNINHIIQKINDEKLVTEDEIEFLYGQALMRLGPVLNKFYSQLNRAGQEKADEQIDRLIDQLELLTKIPEYRKDHQTKTAAPEREPQDGETDTH